MQKQALASFVQLLAPKFRTKMRAKNVDEFDPRSMKQLGIHLDRINYWIYGFVNIRSIFEHHYPNVKNHGLAHLLKHFGLKEREHDALQDLYLLRDLIKAGMKGKGSSNFQKFVKFGFSKFDASKFGRQHSKLIVSSR